MLEVGMVWEAEARSRGFAREGLVTLMKGIFTVLSVDDITRAIFSTMSSGGTIEHHTGLHAVC